MRKLSLEPPEGGFVVEVSLECSSCHLWFSPGDLEGGRCAGCLVVKPQVVKLCGMCDEPVLSNHHWYCAKHRAEVLDRRLSRPGSRPKSLAQAARARERFRVRSVEKRAHDALVYTKEFRATRKALRPQVEAGLADCVRCGHRIRVGQEWDLGHVDGDPTRIAGPEHARAADCPLGGNRATARRDRRRS